MKSQEMLLSFTPDPDDAFAWWGIVTGKGLLPDFSIRTTPMHIQEANEACMRGELDIAAVSAAAYPHFSDNYWFLSVGTSVGRGYGPALVTRGAKEVNWREDVVAVPGNLTTGAMLLRVLYPNVRTVEMPCNEVAPAILNGEVAAGVLIHEELLNWQHKDLSLYSCLGAQWLKNTGLPIPVGLIVVHKKHGLQIAQTIAGALRDSILLAHANREEALEWAMQYSNQAADGVGAQFIDMFTNADCLDMADDCIRALKCLHGYAADQKLIPAVPRLTPVAPDEKSEAVA